MILNDSVLSLQLNWKVTQAHAHKLYAHYAYTLSDYKSDNTKNPTLQNPKCDNEFVVYLTDP